MTTTTFTTTNPDGTATSTYEVTFNPVREGSAATITIKRLSGADYHPDQVQWETFQDATTTATAGSDFTAASGSFNLKLGDGATIAINTLSDSLVEGNETFAVRFTDNNGSVKTLVLTIEQGIIDATFVNSRPDAVNDSFTTSEDTTLQLSSSQLLGNDIDANNDSLTITSVQDATNGTVGIVNGNVVFTPTANYHGAASFTYTISDGKGGSDTATVSVNVTADNDAPTGAATTTLAAGTEDTAYTVSATDLLAGFSDVDGDTLSVAGLAASNGTIKTNTDGSYTITPSANFNGTVTLSYNVVDGNGGSVKATQSYSLTAVNDAPMGAATTTLAAGTEDTAYTVSATDLLAGFSDVDGDTLSVAGLAASNGTIKTNTDGSYTITPSANFNGTVTLSYNVVDGNGGSVKATQSYSLTAVNDAPMGAATTTLAAGTEDTAYTVSATDLLAGFSDVDGDTLSVAGLAASNGTIKTNTDGSYTITPSANFNGTVTLSYNVVDGNGGSVKATQSYSLTAVNDAPMGAATTTLAAGTEDTAYTVSATDLLAGFSDVDGDTLSVAGLAASNGTIKTNTDGSYTITPSANFNGTVTLSYNVVDGNGGSVEATQSYSLTAVNDAPIAATDSIGMGVEKIYEGMEYVISVTDLNNSLSLLSNDSDVERDPIQFVSAASPTKGAITTVQEGGNTYLVYTYTGAALAENATATDSFAYTISDGHVGGTSTGTVNLTVTGLANKPLMGTNQIDTLNGGNTAHDTITALNADDVLYGNGGNDKLFGNNGMDRLFGGDGADVLDGGNGNDRLDGGKGTDILTGGLGADTFVFNRDYKDGAMINTGTDKITDFKLGTDDIELGTGISLRSIREAHFDGNSLELDTVLELSNGGFVQVLNVNGLTFDQWTSIA